MVGDRDGARGPAPRLGTPSAARRLSDAAGRQAARRDAARSVVGSFAMSAAPIVTADSITRIADEARGAVVVNASHGGVYAAYLAATLGAAAAIFNDAGVGRERAGIGGLDYLQKLGVPAATVGHTTARIGDGADMLARGLISH